MIYIIYIVVSFMAMEFVAWSNHKYIMHGFLWRWHRDHHINDNKISEGDEGHKSVFEKNDLFFLIYALPAIVLIICGLGFKIPEIVAIGAGITLYGITYFVLHDMVIHNRGFIKMKSILRFKYFSALVKAHRAHHNAKTADDFRNFGLLLFSKKFYKD